jgi:hypothetical protein
MHAYSAYTANGRTNLPSSTVIHGMVQQNKKVEETPAAWGWYDAERTHHTNMQQNNTKIGTTNEGGTRHITSLSIKQMRHTILRTVGGTMYEVLLSYQ